jgi:hypothetical protein
MAYLAEKSLSKSGTNPLLIYRLANDEGKCYKFKLKRVNRNDFSYVCLGCETTIEVDGPGSVRSVRVKADYTEFLSDPEAIGHFCKPLSYLAADIEQKYRYNFNFFKFMILELPEISLRNKELCHLSAMLF